MASLGIYIMHCFSTEKNLSANGKSLNTSHLPRLKSQMVRPLLLDDIKLGGFLPKIFLQ